MLIGAHIVIQSTDPAADRAFLSDTMRLTQVDAGGGYVILGLPPSEMSVHLGREDATDRRSTSCVTTSRNSSKK